MILSESAKVCERVRGNGDPEWAISLGLTVQWLTQIDHGGSQLN